MEPTVTRPIDDESKGQILKATGQIGDLLEQAVIEGRISETEYELGWRCCLGIEVVVGNDDLDLEETEDALLDLVETISEYMLPSILVSAAVLIYCLLPGTKQAFRQA